ncbi:MAG: AEC family transporter [Candidatus Binatia bacterium]|nr:AEC family transporter [Candidatus Binatia bacterium]
MEPIRMLGYSTIPLMLVSLGYRLNSMKSLTWWHSIAGALIRLVGGFACAYLTVTLLGIDGINRQVILLYGALLSAVVNFILTEKYGQDHELAASIIVLTTLSLHRHHIRRALAHFVKDEVPPCFILLGMGTITSTSNELLVFSLS